MLKRKFLLYTIFSFCAILYLLYGYSQIHATEDISTVETVTASDEDRITRILVLGADRSAGLTDTVFILNLNESTKEVSLLQIPRDTYAEYTDHDYKKLNGAANALGNAGVKRFLSDALGVKLDAYVMLDLDVLSTLVDDIGGVEVDIPREMIYSDPAQELDIRLPSGKVLLDGKTAEHFVRYRSGYANADLGRLDAQKLFLRAVAQKCKHLRLSKVLKAALSALPHVNTDISLPQAVRVITLLMDCDADTFPMATLTGQAVQGVSGAWYYSLNREGAMEMISQFLLPKSQLPWEGFDPNGVFDREDNPDFHAIYQAPKSALPIPIA